jgi:hypothetical protein
MPSTLYSHILQGIVPEPSNAAVSSPAWRTLRGSSGRVAAVQPEPVCAAISLACPTVPQPGPVYFKLFLIAMPLWLLACGVYAPCAYAGRRRTWGFPPSLRRR